MVTSSRPSENSGGGRSASAVGFDLGDTLCEYAGIPLNWEREYPLALERVALSCQRVLTPEMLGTGTHLLLRYNTRRTARQDDREHAAETIFGELLAAWQLPADFLEPSIAAFFAHFRQTLRPFPESVGVLRALDAAGIPTGILTDVPYGMPRQLVMADLSEAGLNLPDERLLTSTMVGRRKPHAAGFRALAKALGVACAQLLYVGNERKDIEGGNGAGCQTVLVWRSSAEPPAWGQAFSIRSLEQLLPLLQLPREQRRPSSDPGER